MNYKNHEFNWIEEYLDGRAEFEAQTWAAAEQERINGTPTPVPPEEFVEAAGEFVEKARQARLMLEDYLNSLSPTTKKEA